MTTSFKPLWRNTSIVSLLIVLALIGGCQRRYRISVSGLVITEDGKVLRDVMISINADRPGPTEKWTGPDGTFTPLEIRFSSLKTADGKLPAASVWFVKEEYQTQKVNVQFPYEPKTFSDVPTVRLNVTLERIDPER